MVRASRNCACWAAVAGMDPSGFCGGAFRCTLAPETPSRCVESRWDGPDLNRVVEQNDRRQWVTMVDMDALTVVSAARGRTVCCNKLIVCALVDFSMDCWARGN